MQSWARILLQVYIYRRFRIGRDEHLDQSEAYRNVYDNTVLTYIISGLKLIVGLEYTRISYHHP